MKIRKVVESSARNSPCHVDLNSPRIGTGTLHKLYSYRHALKRYRENCGGKEEVKEEEEEEGNLRNGTADAERNPLRYAPMDRMKI